MSDIKSLNIFMLHDFFWSEAKITIFVDQPVTWLLPKVIYVK